MRRPGRAERRRTRSARRNRGDADCPDQSQSYPGHQPDARLGARTTIHPDDADYARGQGAEIDDALAVGDRLGPLQVVGVPGKSPGEVALFWEERKLLIVGDALIGNRPAAAGYCPRR